MYTYRTKTYIAGDWDGDSDAIEQLYFWKKNNYYSFDFVDVHSFMQSSDNSLPCSIKKSLRERLNISKCFVLVVGSHTATVTKGSCQFCKNYDSSEWLRIYGFNQCSSKGNIDYRSFIRFECEMALKDYLSGDLKKIVILYNSTYIDKAKCPECLRNVYAVYHVPMKGRNYLGQVVWDYQSIKNAISC